MGLTVIHVFGFRSVRALLLAEKCGVAFQLTNILRDVREDAEMGRVYLPAEDLDRFGVSVEQLRSGQEDEKFRRLMAFRGRARQKLLRRVCPPRISDRAEKPAFSLGLATDLPDSSREA